MSWNRFWWLDWNHSLSQLYPRSGKLQKMMGQAACAGAVGWCHYSVATGDGTAFGMGTRWRSSALQQLPPERKEGKERPLLTWSNDGTES